MSKQLISLSQPSQRLRQDLELLGEMRSHIANLETIYSRQEQELLRKSAGDQVGNREYICRIISHYKAVCAVSDLEISVPDLFDEKVRFWFHITRLRLAWFLRTINVMPDFRDGLVARSVVALSVLSPRLLDVL